jgi:hypothetical protein
MSVDYIERTQTVDPTVSVNGNTTGYTGTISDGQTVSLSTDTSWIGSTNTVDVSVGDGSLSSDAPKPRVDLNYSHSATDVVEVDTESYAWSERFEFNRTYSVTQSDVTVTVPLSDKTVNVTDVETRRNGSTWSSATYQYNRTSGDLDIDAGTVKQGTTLGVRVNSTFVKPVNGDITVLEPTVEGNSLNTLIEVDSVSDGFGIEVGGTRYNRVHRITETSYSESDYVEVDSNGGQTLRLPSAVAGSTGRVKTAPLVVSPSNEVEVVVEDATEPRFRVREGSTAGSDSVSVTYLDAARDTDHSLWSITQERESRSSESDGTNVSFSVGDATASYRIEVASGGPTAAVAVGGGAGTGPLGLPLDLLALLLGVGGTFVGLLVARRRLGLSGRTATYGLLGAGAVVSIVAVELVTPRSIVSDLLFSVSRGAGLLGGGALDGFLSSGAGSITLGLSALIGLYAIDSRLLSLPRWLWIVAGGGITVWIVDTITEGALASGLSEVSALAWLLIILGAIVLLWRALQPTQINIGGDS